MNEIENVLCLICAEQMVLVSCGGCGILFLKQKNSIWARCLSKNCENICGNGGHELDYYLFNLNIDLKWQW